jgi:hypothetical protein
MAKLRPNHDEVDGRCSVLFCLKCGSPKVDVNDWLPGETEEQPLARFVCYDCHHEQLIEGLTIGRTYITGDEYREARADRAKPPRKS